MKILYIFGSSRFGFTDKIELGALPSDTMYGYFELKKMGFDVNLAYVNNDGYFYKFQELIRKILNIDLKNFKYLFYIKNYDLIIIKDEFSTLITIFSKILNKKIIYIDSLLKVPNSKIKRCIYKLNLSLSDGTIVYSKTQKIELAKKFKVSENKFIYIPYSIDCSFYKLNNDNREVDGPYILAVGRDMARDFSTLVEAMDGLNINLKVVSLQYLFEGVNTEHHWLEILEYVSYEKLFRLYRDALFVVIPLKKWGIFYPSGIRAMLEAMTFGKTIVASRSPVLQEYANREEGVIYVEPENTLALRNKILELCQDEGVLRDLKNSGVKTVNEKYCIDIYVSELINFFCSIFPDRDKVLK
jgi:glycosyltransferase involved in cell wall biosynthesis